MACLPQILNRYSVFASSLHCAQGCWHASIAGVGNCPPHVCALENSTPISNDSVAQLGPMVSSSPGRDRLKA